MFALAFMAHGRRIPDDLFKDGKVLKIPFAARSGDANGGLGAPGRSAFDNAHDAVLFEHLKMAGKIAVS